MTTNLFFFRAAATLRISTKIQTYPTYPGRCIYQKPPNGLHYVNREKAKGKRLYRDTVRFRYSQGAATASLMNKDFLRSIRTVNKNV